MEEENREEAARAEPPKGEDLMRESLADLKREIFRSSRAYSLSESPKRDSLIESSKRDSLRDTKRDSLNEVSKRDSLIESSKRDSLKDTKRDSLKDNKRDSIKESGRDSPRLGSLKDRGRDSPRLGSLKDRGRESPRHGSLKDSGRDSLRRSKTGEGKNAADRRRSSGKSLNKSVGKKEPLTGENDKKSDADMVETASMAAKRKALVMERRLLCGCTGLVGLAALIWLVAVCTESWFTVHSPNPEGVYINATSRYFLYSTSGLFKICRYGRHNSTTPIQRVCQYHEMFPSEEKLKAAVWVDRTIINYTRTEMFFSIVSLIFMVMGFLFSIYTFRNPRYMFKRLAAGIHFMSGATVMVVIEVLINSIAYERVSLNVVHPKDAQHTYGFSFYLGWLVFILNSICSITFLIYSKKRKGDKAPNEEIALADEPTIIGR